MQIFSPICVCVIVIPVILVSSTHTIRLYSHNNWPGNSLPHHCYLSILLSSTRHSILVLPCHSILWIFFLTMFHVPVLPVVSCFRWAYYRQILVRTPNIAFYSPAVLTFILFKWPSFYCILASLCRVTCGIRILLLLFTRYWCPLDESCTCRAGSWLTAVLHQTQICRGENTVSELIQHCVAYSSVHLLWGRVWLDCWSCLITVDYNISLDKGQSRSYHSDMKTILLIDIFVTVPEPCFCLLNHFQTVPG